MRKASTPPARRRAPPGTPSGRRRPRRPGRGPPAAPRPAPASPSPGRARIPRSAASCAGRVGVEGQVERPVAGQAAELAHLLLGQRGAHRGDRLVEARPDAARARRCSPPPRSRGSWPRSSCGRDRARTRPRTCERASPSGEFRYLGGSPPGICRAPKPRTRPRASASGNISRPRKRSTGPRRPAAREPRPLELGGEKPFARAAAHTRSQAVGREPEPEVARGLLLRGRARPGRRGPARPRPSPTGSG